MIAWALGRSRGKGTSFAKTVAAFAGVVAVMAAAAASTAHAGPIVNDTWLDGTDSDPAATAYSENGVDADGDGNLESAWFQGGTGSALDPVAAGGPLRGTVGATSASWTTYFTPEAAPVTLQRGETLSVQWAFSITGLNTGNTSQDFRVAVVDSPSASRVSTNASPGSSTYTGYALFSNMAPTFQNSSPFQLREHDGNGALLSSSGDWLALANGFANGGTGYADGVPYLLEMTLTRTDSDALDITTSVTGGTLNGTGVASVNFVDATPASFSFDTFALRPSSNTGTAGTFDVTRFSVDYNAVPEPSSLALLTFAGVAAVRRRRRGRRE
jgi:hypothetical protein